MKKLLIFGKPCELAKTASSVDVLFPYSIIEEKYVGTPEENSKWEEKRIIVKLTDSLIACWNNKLPKLLTGEEIIKVMFEYGWRQIEQRLQNGGLPAEIDYTLYSHEISQTLEFDPERIINPVGANKIAQISRRIGF